ncbi:phage protein NinX family protein [Pragia fontium]|uniref:phage protein NinX family protein n=1 Tax=Pragia fontium TaxID=82985 RepID=UPI00064A3547|nr:phage protein NinX family protein [Pragia fontium]AKJ41757.1 hypothetical protein QQ39_06390 [Pragia fontium]
MTNKTDYSKLSDFEINKRVAEKLELRGIHERAGVVCYTSQGGTSCFFDPCNNPSDAWPVITENSVNIEWGENFMPEFFNLVSANTYHDEKLVAYDVDRNTHSPLRAAMIVFLMMKERDDG